MNIVTVEGQTGTNTFTWTAPAGINAKLNWLHCAYTSDANAGNRQLLFQLLNASDVVLMESHAGAVQAASLLRHYMFVTGIYRETSFVDDEIEISIPRTLLIPPTYKLKLFDSGNTAVGDAMTIHFQYENLI